MRLSVTIGFGVSQFADGVHAISGMERLMNGEETSAPSSVALLVARVIIMSLPMLSAVSGVRRGVTHVSNLNLLLSPILLLAFMVFGSILFAMTTYPSALTDHIFHWIGPSLQTYGPQSEAALAADLPAKAAPLAGELYGGATNALDALSGLQDGLTGAAADLRAATQVSAYEAGTQGRLFGWQAADQASAGNKK